VKRPEIVTRDEWLEARKALLAREKEFDHEHDWLKGTAWRPAKPLGSATTTSMGHHFSVNNLTLTTLHR
jgi:predicted dithiol-disulfide oxidoreductase (DUF899 family)